MGVAIAVGMWGWEMDKFAARASSTSLVKDRPVTITFVLKARLGDTWALFHFLIRKMVSLSNLLHIS